MTVDHVASFQAARPRLFAVAYRVLHDAAEADDVVQDAWTRWDGADRDNVRDVAAFLATTTRRLALNVADSARARRETSAGSWLPESPDDRADPARDVEQREALEQAVLIVMERLSPAERAAYVLREAFDYSYREIARVLAMTEANARQLATRARARLFSRGPTPVSARVHRRFVAAFVAAAESGDLSTLEELLVTDLTARARTSSVPVAA